MDERLQRRLAGNEAVFRDLNEGIQRGQWPGEADAPVSFRCECARLGCNQLLALTPAEYEHIRSRSKRFFMIPGHQMPALELVVEVDPNYVVVEKHDEAGREADRADPRA